MQSDRSLLAELESAIESGSKEKRVDTLRQITDLFVADADRFTDQQIDVFDDVLGQLIKRIEGKALAELSRRLGPIHNAPIESVRRLARDDDIAVAEPVLTQSSRLSDHDLIEIAHTKTHGHRLAIAGRPEIAPGVTDVLLQRGDQKVFHKLAENNGAKFSEHGFATLVKHSEGDEHLAEKVGLRLDVPLRLFRELLMRATEAVRSRLLALAGPEAREKIQSVLAAIAEATQRDAGFNDKLDYAEAQGRMAAMKSGNRLNESVLLQVAKADQYADMVAALSLMCGAPLELVENLLQSDHREAWLIPCKAAGLEWSTVRAIMSCPSMRRTISEQALEVARADYGKLSVASAGRVLRFWQVRHATDAGAAAAGARSAAKPQDSPLAPAAASDAVPEPV